MDGLWPVLLGGALAIAGGIAGDMVRARRERRHDDRQYWRDQSKAAYVEVLRIIRLSSDALDAVQHGDESGQAGIWLDEGAFFAVDDVLGELRLYAPDDIIRMVEQIPVELNTVDIDPRTHLRRTRDRIREHLGIE